MYQTDQTYYSGLGEVLLFVVAGVMFVVLGLLVSRMLRPGKPNNEKLSSYESGEQPQGSGHIRFDFRFYMLALIFLLFEVEAVFLFPWATVFAKRELMEQSNGVWGEYALVEMLIFLALLGLGLAYAWANGHLEWIKSEPVKIDFKSPVPKEMYERYK